MLGKEFQLSAYDTVHIQENFSPYLPGFGQRFALAVKNQHRRDIEVWKSLHDVAQSKVDSACRSHRICEHDTSHIWRTIQNEFFIADIVNHRLGRNFIDDGDLLHAGVHHDIGYGLKGVQWDEYEAINHPQYGALVLEFWSEMKNSGTVFQRQVNQCIQLMQGTAAERQKEIDSKKSWDDMSYDSWLAHILKFADICDRYGRERVAYLPTPKPEEYSVNPYHLLSAAVAGYSLVYDGDAISLKVKFDKGFYAEKNGVNTLIDFDFWQREVYETDQEVWLYAKKFSNFLGLNFRFEEDVTH